MDGARLTVTKPGRSDEVLDADQQLQITNQVRAHFDALTPKRPPKPNRSEPDSASTITTSIRDENIPVPELDKLRSLQSQSQTVIVSGTDTMVDEEFVETQYYNQLDSVDKQHHTTGTGFIKVASEKSENGYDLRILRGGQENYNGRFREFKTNPATNDWIPRVEDYQMGYVSSKPNRSESS